MTDLLQIALQSFWHFVGAMILLITLAVSVAGCLFVILMIVETYTVNKATAIKWKAEADKEKND